MYTHAKTNYWYAAVLHPSHKLEYFKDHGWSQEWIDTARDLTKDEYERKYAEHTASREEASGDKADMPVSAHIIRISQYDPAYTARACMYPYFALLTSSLARQEHLRQHAPLQWQSKGQERRPL